MEGVLEITFSDNGVRHYEGWCNCPKSLWESDVIGVADEYCNCGAYVYNKQLEKKKIYKRKLRLIVSPIYFIVLVAAGFVLPVWFFCFVFGVFSLLMTLLSIEDSYEDVLFFLFAIVILPYAECMNFINETKN